MILTRKLREQIQEHARNEYPRECIGMIVGGAYVPLINDAAEHHMAFNDAPARELEKGTLQALVHSHCCDASQFHNHDCPTAYDMQSQINFDVPFVLCATDGSACTTPFEWGGDREPLLKRGFRHGVTDCYSFIRDWWYFNKDIDLLEVPRTWKWWTNGENNLYDELFAKAGFVEINLCEQKKVPACAQPGDVAFFKVISPVVNHAGVYTGQDTMQHHGTAMERAVDLGKLPQEVSVGRWMHRCEKWLRYVGT